MIIYKHFKYRILFIKTLNIEFYLKYYFNNIRSFFNFCIIIIYKNLKKISILLKN